MVQNFVKFCSREHFASFIDFFLGVFFFFSFSLLLNLFFFYSTFSSLVFQAILSGFLIHFYVYLLYFFCSFAFIFFNFFHLFISLTTPELIYFCHAQHAPPTHTHTKINKKNEPTMSRLVQIALNDLVTKHRKTLLGEVRSWRPRRAVQPMTGKFRILGHLREFILSSTRSSGKNKPSKHQQEMLWMIFANQNLALYLPIIIIPFILTINIT